MLVVHQHVDVAVELLREYKIRPAVAVQVAGGDVGDTVVQVLRDLHGRLESADLYSCDHFVEPNYLLGNILRTPLVELLSSEQQRRFGEDKSAGLPRYCRECQFLFECHGECPKNRFLVTADGEPGLNYLCAGLRAYFGHIDPHMRTMAGLLSQRRPASEIMEVLRVEEAQLADRFVHAGRNDPCPCGSGRKYKKCHGAACAP